jgi:two-component system response regulator QseB
MRILVVEDDKIIGDGVVAGLTMEGYAVDWVEDQETAKTALASHSYEMLILDIGLPDGSGIDILRSVRAAGKTMPALILTAYDDLRYKITSLDSGADDYLIKPFRLEELTARLRALRRRCQGRAEPFLEINDIVLDPAAKKVSKNGKPVILGPKEFVILQTLMEKRGKVVSKTQLEEGLYGWDAEIESNTIEVHIHGLRKKLGKDFIQTVKHVGYVINA